MRFQYGFLVTLPLAAAQLNQLAKKAGKLYFGTATDNGELSNTTYRKILDNTNEFGQLTPSNGMKVRLHFNYMFACTMQIAMAG
jgi:endo-1,4-beta-xylanase